jgi:hypothetical protein
MRHKRPMVARRRQDEDGMDLSVRELGGEGSALLRAFADDRFERSNVGFDLHQDEVGL